VAHEAVDHGGGHDVVAEHLTPAAERLFEVTIKLAHSRREDTSFEEKVGGFGFERGCNAPPSTLGLCRACCPDPACL
jgi:hypothetical protein